MKMKIDILEECLYVVCRVFENMELVALDLLLLNVCRK